jgi:hypothetical protein
MLNNKRANRVICLATFASVVLLSAFALSQPTPQPNYRNPFFPEASLTPDIYWASQPPAVRELRNLPDAERGQRAFELANKGYAIDVYVMVYGYDPVTANGIRIGQGFTWVPSALQPNIPVAPGLEFPGAPSYNPNKPPAGSIKVSIDARDFPAFDPPAPPAPPQAPASMIGFKAYGSVFYCGVGANRDTVEDGKEYAKDGKFYLAHTNQGLMGWQCYMTAK